MSFRKLSLQTLVLMSVALGLVGCGTSEPAGPTPDIIIEISGTDFREIVTESVSQPNCGGTAEVENKIERSRAIAHTIEVQSGIEVNANGQIGFAGTDVELGATVASQLGYSYGTVESISRSIAVKAKAGTNMVHYIKQQEVWKIGTARIAVNDQELTVPFSFRHDFAIELISSQDMKDCSTLVVTPPGTSSGSPTPGLSIETPTPCFPQTGWTPPKPTADGEWIYDCLSSGEGNWVGQSEAWKAANWKRGMGQSEIVNIVVPTGATKMGLGCDPCTVLKPDGTSLSSSNGSFGPFRPNLSMDVKPGEIYKVKIFGGDTCPSRPQAIPPCSPEIYIWFNLPPSTTVPVRPLCYGTCWEYDEAARTMTWTGPTDGREDVWQPAGKPLDSIRAGYTAIFGPMSVPGEIEACFLVLNGQSVKNGCDGVWYPVPVGKVFRATSTGQIGGFRWQPADGYGYRAP